MEFFKKALFFVLIIFSMAMPIIISHEYKQQKGQAIDVSEIKYESMPKANLKEEIEEIEEVVEEFVESQPVNLGKFKLTAYCACSKCCGKWAGTPTASGTIPKNNHTIAVDTSIIPFGTKVIINGSTYVAEDTGSAIKGNKIDVYFDNHEEALKFGVKYADVSIVK